MMPLHRTMRRIIAPLQWTLAFIVCLLTVQDSLQAQDFNPRGKRDPFVDLRTIFRREEPQNTDQLPPLSQRPPGLPGLAIEEVTVTGLAVGEDSRIAFLRGADNFTYLAREGDKLFNGRVSSISEEGVVFIREFTDREGKQHTTRIVKRLYTEETD